MKNYYKVFLLIFFISSAAYIHSQGIVFEKKYYDWSDNFTGRAVVQAFDHSFIVAGAFEDYALAINIDSAGDTIWAKKYKYNDFDEYNGVCSTSDSCFVFVGRTISFVQGYADVLVTKMNILGDTVWNRAIDLASSETGLTIKETFDGGFIVTGYSQDTTPPHYHFLATKIDSSGMIEWSSLLAVTNHENIGHSAVQTPDSGYIITGNAASGPPYFSDAALIKLTPTGLISWSNLYNTSARNFVGQTDVLITANNIWHYFLSSNDLSVVKLDLSGNVLWSRIFPDPSFNLTGGISPKIHLTPDNNLIFTNGRTINGGPSPSQIFKLDSAGGTIWVHDVLMRAKEIIHTIDGGYFILGNGPLYPAPPTLTVTDHIGIIKTDSFGNSPNCTVPNLINTISDTILKSAITATQTFTGISNPVFAIISPAIFITESGCVDFDGGETECDSDLINLHVFLLNNEITFKYNTLKELGEVSIYTIEGKLISSYSLLPWSNIQRAKLPELADGIYLARLKSKDQSCSVKFVVE